MAIKNNFITRVISCTSLIFSLGAMIFSCFITNHSTADWLITIYSLLVTLLMGWNIYTAVGIKNEWEEYKKDMEIMINALKYKISSEVKKEVFEEKAIYNATLLNQLMSSFIHLDIFHSALNLARYVPEQLRCAGMIRNDYLSLEINNIDRLLELIEDNIKMGKIGKIDKTAIQNVYDAYKPFASYAVVYDFLKRLEKKYDIND